jgi:hypothetical protein
MAGWQLLNDLRNGLLKEGQACKEWACTLLYGWPRPDIGLAARDKPTTLIVATPPFLLLRPLAIAFSITCLVLLDTAVYPVLDILKANIYYMLFSHFVQLPIFILLFDTYNVIAFSIIGSSRSREAMILTPKEIHLATQKCELIAKELVVVLHKCN